MDKQRYNKKFKFFKINPQVFSILFIIIYFFFIPFMVKGTIKTDNIEQNVIAFVDNSIENENISTNTEPIVIDEPIVAREDVEQVSRAFDVRLDFPYYIGTPYYITDLERHYIEQVVMGEGGTTEPFEGLMAVAQVILDRITSDYDYFSKDIITTLTQTNAFAFPYWEEATDDVKLAVSKVFDEGCRVTDIKLYYFLNPTLCPTTAYQWNYEFVYVTTIANHAFYSAN